MSPAPTPEGDEMTLHLHAELLPNIRQVTLYVSLPQLPALQSNRPQVQLSESCKSVTVSLSPPLEHVTETLKLPARVSGAVRHNLNLSSSTPFAPRKPADSGFEYSLRMVIDPQDEPFISSAPETVSDDHVPWTAADMSPRTRIRCRECKTQFLKDVGATQTAQAEPSLPESGWVWKDLPSGNWAEMMDFWHCHKPDPHEHDSKPEADAALKLEGETAQMKGFGADSRVQAIPGTVLIDVPSFLLCKSDCINLKKTSEDLPETFTSAKSFASSLQCAKCNAIVGIEDPPARGWRLLKTNLSLNANPECSPEDETAWQSHPVQQIVAAQLLELIERESARRFVVHCGHKDGLLLWVFNPNLRYSSSGSGHGVSAQNAMKVLHQSIPNVDELLTPEIGNPSPLSVEELELPAAQDLYQMSGGGWDPR
ncbi:Uncharacterized protein PECH_007525 [Penicillium ucsense]|uniref:Ubiquitin-conjugating enzyme E2-binding protein n=1 Tax=Penicillium ucsense TaxID=2839758 RepID=A0A8J8W391_9EURO|nr:Uncharacterized protein PECM_004421 [Penicillium ucsense]KAF7738824.1 Uncharacterized protein PECH_007525 [Penicillium ucsense]